MRRSPSSHTRLLRLALLLMSLPLVAIALAAPAWAATVPAPSPGPPVVPSSAPLGDALGMLLTGALVGVAALAVAVLIMALASRRLTAAPALPAARGMTLERPLDHGASSVTALPEQGRDQQKTHMPAA